MRFAGERGGSTSAAERLALRIALRSVLAGAVLGAACGERDPEAGPPSTEPRNVLVVVLDDVGTDMIGAYGARPAVVRTPVVDALAARGVRFEHAWATPLCTPTRAALQTGRYGFRTGVGTVGPGGLSEDELTLPEMLRLGTGGKYATAAIGKWHLGDDDNGGPLSPNRAGYDRFSGPLGNLPDYFHFRKVVDGESQEVDAYATSDQATDALAWMRGAPEPWFCYLAFSAAHRPLHVPPRRLLRPPLGEPTTDPGRAAFSAMVEALDTELGRVLDGIDPEVLSRTSILVLSDNGTHRAQVADASSHAAGKGSVQESGIRVPLVVAGPDVREPGRAVDGLVDVTDVFATVAEWAGVDLDALRGELAGPLDSVSLVPYLREPGCAPLRETAFAECFRPNGPGPHSLVRRALRDERYKLVHLERDGKPPARHLYDLELDPGETRDLLREEPEAAATRAAHERLAARLDALLDSP